MYAIGDHDLPQYQNRITSMGQIAVAGGMAIGKSVYAV
jgi:hypothetical protein